MATCPEPSPAPGTGLGLLLPLGETIARGDPDIPWCGCSLEDAAVPGAGAGDVLSSSPSRRRGPLGSCGLSFGRPRHGAPFCYSALLSAQMVPRRRAGERSVLLRSS